MDDVRSDWRDADPEDWAKVWGMTVEEAKAKITEVVAQDEAAMQAAVDFLNGEGGCEK